MSSPGAAVMPPIPSAYTTSLVASAVVFLVLAFLAIGLRIYSARISSGREWMTTDLWLVTAALLVIFGAVLANLIGAGLVGLNHIGTRMSLASSAAFTFKVYFADVILTTVSSGLCKVSILEFYKRIFITRAFQNLCNVVIFLVSAWMIGTFFTQLFSTTPISSAWNPQLQAKDANYNYPKALLAIFGIGLVLDVLVLSLPLRPIWKLQLKTSKKIKIFGILWLGIFCVVCASVRFYYANLQLNTVFKETAEEKANITVKSSIWSILEPSASIIAACLPTYGPLMKTRSLGSIFKSVTSLFSLRSASHTSTSSSSKNYQANDSPMDEGGVKHNWHELRANDHSYDAKIDASSTRSLTRPEDNHIHTTSELVLKREARF